MSWQEVSETGYFLYLDFESHHTVVWYGIQPLNAWGFIEYAGAGL